MKQIILSIVAAVSVCSCGRTPAPEAILPVPTDDVLAWQKLEMYAFVHFGLNTFNDLEWGYGDSLPSTFNPEDLDCDQWARTFKEIGLKGVILTAKHHDGFCLWPTQTTEYCIRHSPWKDGKGDVVKDLSEACRKYGLKFGLYLSPWDRNNAEYAREGYVKTYHNQIRELISAYGPLFEFWFDGANGGDGWYGGACERRSIDPVNYYQYKFAKDLIKEKHPHAVIFGGPERDVRWIGNERGWAGGTQWCMYDLIGYSSFGSQFGKIDGLQWMPAETDVSIRPGWFYHKNEDSKLKSLPKLLDIYYESVGHNTNLILNFPVALKGKIHPADSARLVEWGETLRRDFSNNRLSGARVKASDVRGRGYSASKVKDGDYDSYWATGDGVTDASLVFNFRKPEALNRFLIQEYVSLGQRVTSFSIEYADKDGWKPVHAVDSLTTVGYKRIVRFRTVESDSFRICFSKARGALCINNVEAYLADPVLSEPALKRTLSGNLEFSEFDDNVEVRYTVDGSNPSEESAVYSAPVPFLQKGVVKAACRDPRSGKWGPVLEKEFDIPASEYVPAVKGLQIGRLFDGEGKTVFTIEGNRPELRLKLRSEQKVCGFRYLPSQRMKNKNHITHYRFLVDGKAVSEGEFSNIVNNPVWQEVRFPSVCAHEICLQAVRMSGEEVGIGEFSLITE